MQNLYGFEVVNTPTDGDQYAKTTPHGFLRGYFTSESGRTFRIAYVEVEPEYRGNGYGKELVAAAVLLARELGAKVVTATVISRGMYGVCQSLYGPSSLTPQTWERFTALGDRAGFSYPLLEAAGDPSSKAAGTGEE